MKKQPTSRLAQPFEAFVFPLAAILALSGCAALLPGSDIEVTSYRSSDGWLNAPYHTIAHPFSDDGAARAQARAVALCSEEKRVAVRGERACSLERCTTQYVCVNAEDARASGLDSGR